MSSQFDIRAIFPGASGGLRQFFSSFNVSPAGGLRLLAASALIEQLHQGMGGYKGRLGVALSSVTQNAPVSFVRSFEGGMIQVTDAQAALSGPQSFITVSYQGAHCFGSPKFPESHSGYVMVIIYVANKQSDAKVVKLPDDAGGDTYDGWDQSVDQTEGQGIIFGGTQEDAPTDLVIETLVMGHEPLGDPKGVKQKISDAVQQAGSAASAAEGVPPDGIPPAVYDILTAGLFAVVDALFGVTDQVRGRPVAKTIKYADWDTLPPLDSQQIGNITFNWETDLMTDGDASYKAFFNLAKHTFTP